jgi:DNA primase
MDILQAIENIGHVYKKAASTGGGEYKGPCPWCGGNDRFSILPEKDHYVCRRCKKAGDIIQFYRDFDGLSYHEACLKADRTPEFKKTFLEEKFAKKENWNPREVKSPPQVWQENAETVTFQAFKYLMSPMGKPHREYLYSRGLTIETIKKARIGWNNNTRKFDRETWGLERSLNKAGYSKTIWVPRGFLIPFFLNGKITRIRVRQDKPVNDDQYILLAGSSTEYFSYPSKSNPFKSIFLVEAELDGWLSWQEFGDLSDVKAIGNSTARPDVQTHEELSKNQPLLCLDNDDAGREEVKWWKIQYPGTITCPVPAGKDPGEAYEKGINLRDWFEKQADEKRFVQKSLPPKKKNKIKSKPENAKIDETKIDETKKMTIKTCAHGRNCVHAKNYICLISKKNCYEMNRCPKDQWYTHKKGNITEFILGFGVR